MLTKEQIRKIMPHYGDKSYKGIWTRKGIWTFSKYNQYRYTMDIDLKEAMRETGHNYRIIRKWSDDLMTHIKYEVL